MYQEFFALNERPFDLAPDPRFLFLGGRQREALSTLRYALSGPKGMALVIGEAGTGKTTLVQAVLREIRASDVQCVHLSNPTLTRSEFYEFLADGFGLGPEANGSKTRFLFALRRHIEERHTKGQVTALLIDEAQSLPHELLEEVRLLSNIETTTSKLLTVILAGQPELADRLNDPQLRQLKQRIALRCELSTLSLTETAAYIAGRLRIAGGVPAEVFTRNAVESIYEGSGGVPRIINVICENALIGAYAAQIKPVTQAHVDEVLHDFKLEMSRAATPAGDAPSAAVPEPAQAQAKSAHGALASSPAKASAQPPKSESVLFGMFGRKKRFAFFQNQ